MALVSSGSFGSPTANYELYAEQTGGSGNQRTIKVTFKIKIANKREGSSYGFPLNWKARIHNSYSDWMFVKDSSYWKSPMDWKTYTWTQTVNVGTANATNITVGFQLEYPRGNSSWNQTRTGTFQTGQTNVAPSQPGWINVRANSSNGPLLNGQVNENINNFYITWGASSDGNGDTIYYDLQEQRNNGAWVSIDGHGTDTAHQFNTTGGEGTTYYYSVNARDNKGGASGWTYSGKITKNIFTMATLASSSSVSYSGNPLTFTYSGGGNTQGGISISYSISCEQLTVYNGSNFSSGSQVKFNWGQGGGTSGAYINWNDLVNYFKRSQGKGTLTFVLTGRNSNGTVKTSKKTINVNIQTSPGSLSGAYIVEDGARSTAYRRVKDTGAWYFIPDGSKTVQVNWNRANGNIGDSVRYRIYVSYNNERWQELATVNNPPYNHIIPKQNRSVSFKYMIRALSSFNEGLYSEAQTPSKTLHYYNGVSLSKGTVTRTANSAEARVTIRTSTSIPGMKTTGSWSGGGGSGSLSSTQSEQTIRMTNLSENSSYTLAITYNDTTGFSSDQTENISIGANQPIFFVNQHGVGVGGAKAYSKASLVVRGNIESTGAIDCVVDTRRENQPPSYYRENRKGIGFEFKDKTAIGLNCAGVYCCVMTVCDWGDNSGGKVYQLAFSDNGLWWRDGYSGDRGYSNEWRGWLGIPWSSYYNEDVVTEDGGSVIHGSLGQLGGTMEAGGDFNSYLTEGEYAVAGENHKNGPIQGASHLYGKLIVKVSDGGTHNNQNNWIWQTFISTEWDGIFMRRKVNSSSWTPWKMAPMTEPPTAYTSSTLELEVDPKERILALEEEVAELKETIKELIEGKALN